MQLAVETEHTHSNGLRFCDKCLDRPATMTARSLGGPETAGCTRCFGSICLRFPHGGIFRPVGKSE